MSQVLNFLNRAPRVNGHLFKILEICNILFSFTSFGLPGSSADFWDYRMLWGRLYGSSGVSDESSMRTNTLHLAFGPVFVEVGVRVNEEVVSR